jgi:hypothetical protein
MKRGRLQERLDTFQRQAADIFQAATEAGDDDSWDNTLVREPHIGIEFDGLGEDDDNDNEDLPSAAEEHDKTGNADAETMSLHLPSHLGRDWCNRYSAEDLAMAELRLREGQLNDSLHHIRIALGHKSYLFRNEIRPARTQRLKTRAWAGVHAVESTVQHHARVYTRARQAMIDLGAAANILDRYKVLSRQDLSVSTTVIAPDVRGQRNKSLPWFWTMDVRRDTDVGEWMEDCMCLPSSRSLMNLTFHGVFRVHWLRAKAQQMRWIEELQCLQVEMESAVRYFKHQERVWKVRGEIVYPESQPGHAAWAAKQSEMWRSMAIHAHSTFTTLLNDDPPPEFATVSRPN